MNDLTLTFTLTELRQVITGELVFSVFIADRLALAQHNILELSEQNTVLKEQLMARPEEEK